MPLRTGEPADLARQEGSCFLLCCVVMVVFVLMVVFVVLFFSLLTSTQAHAHGRHHVQAARRDVQATAGGSPRVAAQEQVRCVFFCVGVLLCANLNFAAGCQSSIPTTTSICFVEIIV